MKYQPPYGSPDPEGPYVNGDPTIGRQGSIPPAASIEYPQREIVNFIADSDQAPTDEDLHQLTRGIRNQWVNFCVDTGSANAMSTALLPPLTTYKQGTPLRVLVANNNTGSTTINVNGLGQRMVKRASGAQLAADDLRAGMIALLVDDGTSFQLVNYQGAAAGSNTSTYIDIPYAEDSSLTENTVLAAFAPAITAPAVGDVILVKIANRNSTAATIAVNALPAIPIVRCDNLPVQGGDLIKGETVFLVKQPTCWQLMRLVNSQVYFKLTANLTLYVRPDGDDTTGDGSVNDAAHAFKTIQAAINFVSRSFLIAGRTVTIKLGVPGTYQGSVSITNVPGRIIVEGDRANPNSYVVRQSSPATSCTFGVSGSGTSVSIVGFLLAPISSGYSVIECNYGGTLSISDISFGGVAIGYSLVASTAGVVTVSNYIHAYASYGYFFSMQNGASLTIGLWFTQIIIHGSIQYYAFILCWNHGSAMITYPYCTFAGGASGPRYTLVYNSNCITGGGESYLPGNSGGYLDYSSVYN